MATMIQRATKIKHEKTPWQLQGTWGTRELDVMPRMDFYAAVQRELIADGLLPADSPRPSNSRHTHITEMLAKCSWIDGHWLLDESLVAAS